MPEGISDENKLDRTVAAIALLKAIKPSNEIEGMLATQMVGTHSAAMECLHRAMVPNQTFESRELNLKHAARLMSLYIGQVDALNKTRGKGQQKVAVEHIYVEAGAQAVIGNVQTGRRSDAHATKAPPALAHMPSQTLDIKATKRARITLSRKRVGHIGIGRPGDAFDNTR